MPIGWFYRKDWFAKPEIQAEFKAEIRPRPRRAEDLARAEGDRRSSSRASEIDGKKVYGAAIFTERASEGITMGATAALYAYGFKYEKTPGKYDMEGAVNSPDAVKGLEEYKELYKCCTPPGYTDAYMSERPGRLQIGPGGDGDELVRLLARAWPRTRMSAATRSASSSIRKRTTAASTLGGQGISVVANTDNMEGALQYIKWFAQPDVQKKWWALGGYSCHKAVLNDPSFKESQPFAADFLVAMGQVQDFWQEPAYAAAPAGDAEAPA